MPKSLTNQDIYDRGLTNMGICDRWKMITKPINDAPFSTILHSHPLILSIDKYTVRSLWISLWITHVYLCIKSGYLSLLDMGL